MIIKLIKTGQKPGKGWYICMKCKEDLCLDDDTDVIPPCAKCDGTVFRRVRLFCKNCGRRVASYTIPVFKGFLGDGSEVDVSFCTYCRKN